MSELLREDGDPSTLERWRARIGDRLVTDPELGTMPAAPYSSGLAIADTAAVELALELGIAGGLSHELTDRGAGLGL